MNPEVAYDKAASLLRPGGRLALLSHRVVGGPMSGELDAVIARCAPSFPLAPGRTVAAEVERALRADASDVSAVLAAIEGNVTWAVGAGSRFGPAEVSWVEWDQQLAAPDPLQSLRATVAWPAVPPSEQAALEAGVADLARRHAGRLPRRRVTFLVVATVRDSPNDLNGPSAGVRT